MAGLTRKVPLVPVALVIVAGDVLRLGRGRQCWAGWPDAQAARVTGVPGAGDWPVSRHRAPVVMAPPGVMTHRWPAEAVAPEEQRARARAAGLPPDAGVCARHLPGIPAESGPGGRVQAWSWVPAQPPRTAAVPLARLAFGSVRHRPVWVLARPPNQVCCQIWARRLSQDRRAAVIVPRGSVSAARHVPPWLMVPSRAMVQRCPGVLPHGSICAAGPEARGRSARHLPALSRARRTCPVVATGEAATFQFKITEVRVGLAESPARTTGW